MVSIMDEVVGSVTDAMKRRGMWGDTLVVLTSDNGGASFTGNTPPFISNNYPLKGSKGTAFEGGIRVASFVSGGFFARSAAPGTIGTVRDKEMVHIADWYQCRATGPHGTLMMSLRV
jgi:arylsulfatase A-like enzyme